MQNRGRGGLIVNRQRGKAPYAKIACSGTACGEDGLLLGDGLGLEKKKRERAPAVKA